MVAAAMYKQDNLSVITDTFQIFFHVLNARRAETKSFQNFETRFDAAVCRLKSSCNCSELPSAIVSFISLANAIMDGMQRISILAAATPIRTQVDPQRRTTEVLSYIKYNDIAAILRSSDQLKIQSVGNKQSKIPANDMEKTGPSRQREKRPKRTLSPEELGVLKSKSTCRSCGNKGHWAYDTDKCPKARSRANQYDQ